MSYANPTAFDKTEVKANPEKDEMGDGAQPVDFRRQDKIGAQQRHRHLGKVEIELNSRADEERAGQNLRNSRLRDAK